MIAYPYFLSAFGLIVVIVGFILAGLSNSTPSRERGIHSRCVTKKSCDTSDASNGYRFRIW